MLISLYSNKSLIYLFIYVVFKFIFYMALTNLFSSFLPSLYLISISKIFTFLLYKLKYKIQSMEENDNILRRIGNQEQLINNQSRNNNPSNNANLDDAHFNRRKKVISWIMIFCISMLELIFYALFNKILEDDTNQRGYYYLMNNKLFFLLLLSFLYLGFLNKYNNKHNILAIILLIIFQLTIYVINYIYFFQNYLFIIYSFFLNIIYSIQNFFEKKLIIINDNHEKHTMYIASEEGIIELIIVIILTIGIYWCLGSVPTFPFLQDYTLTVKIIFLSSCIIFTEFVRLDTLKDYNPFYICFFEEIIYICFWIYNSFDRELTYIIFHLINIFAFFVFIEVIELNFCGLNQKTERFLREREFELLNLMIEGVGSGSSLSTGSNSRGNSDHNNDNQDQNHEIILNEQINIDIFDNNENNHLIENYCEVFDDNQKDDNIKENFDNINIGPILGDDD